MKLAHVCTCLGLALGAVIFGGCQSNLSTTAPPVTESFLRASPREKGNPRILTHGREVFLNRCIQCHALPHVAKFDAQRLTALLEIMSRRANLNPAQHDALLKYLLTVRSLSASNRDISR